MLSNQTDRYREQAHSYKGMHSKCQIEMRSNCGSERDSLIACSEGWQLQ